MITNTAVTIYHETYDKARRMDAYEVMYYPAASLQEDVKITVLQDGPRTDNLVKIRIPTTDNIKIKNGDRVVCGRCTAAEPPDDAYTVVGFADNRKGSKPMQHWKVVCQ